MSLVSLCKRSLFVLSLLFVLLGGRQTILAIDCPPGTTPEVEAASLSIISRTVQESQYPSRYVLGGEGIAGTSDGGALVTDSQGGRVVKIDISSPRGEAHVLGGGGTSLQDDIPATDALLFFPTSITEHNDSVIVVSRNGPYGKDIIKEMYPKDGKYYIRFLGGIGNANENYPMPAPNADFGEIQNIVSISPLTFLVACNKNGGKVWRVTLSPQPDGSNAWVAWKIVGDGQSGATLTWVSGIDVTRTADGKYQDLLVGATTSDSGRRILRFTGNWIGGKGQMSFASESLSGPILALLAQPDGSIVFSSYDRIQQIKQGQTTPEIIAGGGNIVPPYQPGTIYRFAVNLQQVVNLAHVGKLTVTPGTFLMADRATSLSYMFIPEHEYCNPGLK